MKRKAIFLLQDGLGGRPNPEQNGLTELEAAHTPNMDRIVTQGICGIMDPMGPGIRVGTDVGHLALFGYNPLKVYDGRGPVEAAGIGLELEEGDLALRGNFATVDDQMNVVDRRAGRIRRHTHQLASALNGLQLDEKVTVFVKEATEHRAVVVLRGDRFSSYITDVDPGEGNEGVRLPESRPRKQELSIARRTSELINRFTMESYRILNEHPLNAERVDQGKLPANIIITRGAGSEIRIKSITDKFGISGTCIAGESTVRGIARMAGFKVVFDPAFTANMDTDLRKKADTALRALEHSDLVVIHTKGTDIAGHDNRSNDKVEFIQRVDGMMGYILKNLPADNIYYFGFAGDHSTPPFLRTHSADPVPVVISGPDVLRDDVTEYGERACAKGGLGRVNANEMLLCLLDYLNKSFRFGA